MFRLAAKNRLRVHTDTTLARQLDRNHPHSRCVLCTPPDKKLQGEKAKTTALDVT